MTNQQILTKAIEKAIEGGWELPHEAYDFEARPNDMIRFTSIDDETQDPGIWYMPLEQLIFYHDFAKALWGDGWNATSTQPNWQYHLQQMVIAEDPIKYLGENI